MGLKDLAVYKLAESYPNCQSLYLDEHAVLEYYLHLQGRCTHDADPPPGSQRMRHDDRDLKDPDGAYWTFARARELAKRDQLRHARHFQAEQQRLERAFFRHPCADGHNFQPIEKSYQKEYKEGAATVFYRVIYCTKCAMAVETVAQNYEPGQLIEESPPKRESRTSQTPAGGDSPDAASSTSS